MKYQITLTEFGAIQLRAMRISRLGMQAIKVGVPGVPVSGLDAAHPAVEEVQKGQTALRHAGALAFTIVEVEADEITTKIQAARALGFKSERCASFIAGIEKEAA